MTVTPRRSAIGLGAILALAAAIRIASADYGLWFDEIASIAFAQRPLADLWSGWMVRETNPPLFYTLLKGWMTLAGTSDLALRLLPIAIGLAGVAIAWALARRVGGEAAGLLAAAMLALSVADTDMSQQVRGYILAHTAALAATCAMAEILERRGAAPLAGYAVAMLVALYSHTTMAAVAMLANAAMLILLRKDQRAILAWLATNLVVAAGWGWWIRITLAQLRAASGTIGWIGRPAPGDALRVTENVFLPGYTMLDGSIALGLLLALAIAGVVWFAWRDRRPVVLLLAMLALGAPLLLLALSQSVPVLLPRTLFWASGPWIVLVAVAITQLPSRAIALTLAGVVLIFETTVLVRWMPAREREDWRGALSQIAARDPRAILLVQGDAMALAAVRYAPEIAPGLRIVAVPRMPGRADAWADGLARNPHLDAKAAARLLRSVGVIYALRRADSDPAGVLRAAGREQRLTDPPSDRQPYVSRWRPR